MILEKENIVVLDPRRLNRGQPIHFDSKNSVITACNSIDSKRFSPSFLNVEKQAPKSEVKNVVFIDWFEATLRIENVIDFTKDFIQLSDEIYIKNKHQRTGHYEARWELYYLGEEFGILLTNPTQKFIHERNVQFKVNNYKLYQKDWLDDYKEILRTTNWTHISTSRLDIALDGEAGTNGIELTERWLKGRVIRRKGKAVIQQKYLPSKKVIGFYVGSSKSDKSATVYSKTDELKQSEKQYIADAWNKNNLKSREDVNRFELRMKSKITSNYDWTKFDDPDYLSSILRTESKNWFEFYYQGKDTNKHRMYKHKTVDWVEWDSIKGQLLEKTEATNPTGVHRAKRVIKDLLTLHHLCGKQSNKAYIEDLIDEYNLHRWYASKIDSWMFEWNKINKFKERFNSN